MPYKDPEARKAHLRAYRAAHPNLRKEEYQRNRDAIRARNARWYAEHGDEWCARIREKRRAAPEKFREADRQRLKSDGDRIRANARARYAKNPSIKSLSGRKYRQNHPEIIRIRQHKYRQTQADRLREYRRAWRRAHPDAVQNYQQKRHAARRSSAALLTPAQWQEIKAAYAFCCVYCGRKMQRLTMDHIVPLAKGGTHTLSNVVPACGLCNSKKGARKPLVPVQPLLLTIAPSRSRKKKES